MPSGLFPWSFWPFSATCLKSSWARLASLLASLAGIVFGAGSEQWGVCLCVCARVKGRWMPVFMCVGMGVGMGVAVGGQRVKGV